VQSGVAVLRESRLPSGPLGFEEIPAGENDVPLARLREFFSGCEAEPGGGAGDDDRALGVDTFLGALGLRWRRGKEGLQLFRVLLKMGKEFWLGVLAADTNTFLGLVLSQRRHCFGCAFDESRDGEVVSSVLLFGVTERGWLT
jgi:hypothetical protein